MQLILDYIYSKSICVVCPIFNICLFATLNYVSLGFLLKACLDRKNVFKKIYISNLCLMSAFYLHCVLFIFNHLFGFYFSSIDLFFIYKNQKKCCYRDSGFKKIISFSLPNFIYLIYELYLTWLSYSYTYSFINTPIYEKVNNEDNENHKNNEIFIESEPITE